MKYTKSLWSATLLALAACGGAQAESTYGYSTAGTTGVTASAKLNISVVVPKVVLLRVGAGGATVDTVSFATQVAIPRPAGTTTVTGAAPDSNAADNAINWTGAAPTVGLANTTGTAAAFAWTNGSSVKVNCATTTDFAGGGPALTDITAATTTGDMPHPGGTLGACVATGNLTAGQAYSGTWTYTLGGTGAAGWAPGTYSAVVTYSASDI